MGRWVRDAVSRHIIENKSPILGQYGFVSDRKYLTNVLAFLDDVTA